MIDGARDVAGKVCRVKTLLPGLLWLVFVVVFAGVGAAAETHSLLLPLALPAAVVATLAVWVAWTLVTKRFARRSPELSTDVVADLRQWADFQRSFWSYVDALADAPPRTAE